MLTDIEIAQQTKLRPIAEIAEELHICPEELEPYGRFKAKLNDDLFKRLEMTEIPLPSPQRIKSRTERWPTGLNEEVMEIRAQNKERILHILIQKLSLIHI